VIEHLVIGALSAAALAAMLADHFIRTRKDP